jgi:penicillin-insensitive murein endopeptidase
LLGFRNSKGAAGLIGLMRLAVLLVVVLCVGMQGADAKKKKKQAAKARQAVTAKVSSPVARDIFGAQKLASPLAARAIGSYARGCLAGGKALPIDGPAWQAMRLSRNRNWGHPALIAYLERLAQDAKAQEGWPGLLVGDMSQPMGGPMLTGHASHQVGLDADIWLNPMPASTLSPDERETRSAVSMLAEDGVSVDPKIWTPDHAKLIKRAASYPQVARIFVHPAIKKALCGWAGTDKGAWLSKVRPWWGHNYHFHVRLACPAGAQGCVAQPLTGDDDGCGKEVESWLKRMRKPVAQPAPPAKPAKPGKAKRPLTLVDLPVDCAKLVGVPRQSTEGAVPTAAVPMPERKPQPNKKAAEKQN